LRKKEDRRAAVRESAHKVVEAVAGGGQFAQRKPGDRARRHRPQEQSEVGEIPAFGKNLNEFSHYPTAAVKNSCGIIQA
jgi:hypothetical protein